LIIMQRSEKLNTFMQCDMKMLIYIEGICSKFRKRYCAKLESREIINECTTHLCP
jgi:hypothetical protein